MANIGTTVFEILPDGSVTITEQGFYNAAMLVRSERGPLNKVFSIANQEAYNTIFGGPTNQEFYSWYAVQGIFDNAPSNLPPVVHCIREFDPGAIGTAASFTFGSGGNELIVTAGFRGDEDPGVWANSLRVQLQAGSVDNSFILVVFRVDEDNETSLLETSPEFTFANAEAVINTFSKYVKVDVVGNPGLNQVQVDTLDLAGIAAGTADITIQVGDGAPVVVSVPFNTDPDTTASDLEVAIDAQFSGLIATVVAGSVITTSSVEPGTPILYTAPSQVVVTNTIPNVTAVQPGVNTAQVDNLDLTGIVAGNAAVTLTVGTNAPISVSVPFNTDEDTTAQDLATAIEQSGATVSVAVAGPVITVTSLFAGTPVVYSGATGLTVVAVTPNSSALEVLAGGVDPGLPNNVQAVNQLDLLEDTFLVNHVFSVERFDTGWANLLEAWARNTSRKSLALFMADSTLTPTSDFAQYSLLRKSNSFMAGYFNWGYVNRAVGEGEIMIPLLGHIYGTYYVNNKVIQGNFVHIAPAGLEVAISGVNRLQFRDELNSTLVTSIARNKSFNVIELQPGFGIVTQSSRSFSTRNAFISIHIRDSKNFIIQSAERSLKVFQQKPNNERTRTNLQNTLRQFLSKRFEEGMFETIGGFDNNVSVICDLSNNDLQTRQNRRLVADMILNFVEIAEEVNIRLQQSEGPFVVEES